MSQSRGSDGHPDRPGELRFPRLFEPGRVGAMETKNRLVMSPLDDNMADRKGGVTEQKIAYFRRRAEGGVGWINTGYAYIVERGRGCTYFQLGIYGDALVPGLRRLTDAVHEFDVRIGCQIAHAGRQTTRHYIGGLQPEAPSAVPEHYLGEMPEELSKRRIQDVLLEFGKAAVRAREAGFDLVEIHGAHGYLPHSFLSPLGNLRVDEYGGGLENRARFCVETVEAVRAAVGSDYPVGYRISGDEFVEGGFTLDDVLVVVPLLEDAGIDYIHISGGSYESVQMIVGPFSVEPGYLEPLAASVKRIARVPVLSVGRYNSPAVAEEVLERGGADFIVMGRALVADPDLPKKARAGRSEEIRPCIACEQGCLDRWFSALDITCVYNPETGRELFDGWGTVASKEERTGCRVLVVGGGPAGLEAARTAALLGHDVTLWERKSALGGQLALTAIAWGELVDWLVHQVERLGVGIVLDHQADRDAVLAESPTAVILATGARPAPPRWVAGWNGPNVTDPFAVLGGQVEPGERVVVVGGDTIGCWAALHLAATGREVTLVGGGRADLFADDSDDFAFDFLGGAVRPMVLEWLQESVTLIAKRHLKRVTPDGVVLDLAGAFSPHVGATRIGPVDERFVPADTVVLGTTRRPVDELYDQLLGHVPDLYLVGDAVHPRTIQDATAEGSAAARSVGGRVPASA